MKKLFIIGMMTLFIFSCAQKVENEVKEKVLSVLGSVYGTKNVKVSPAATIDFSQTTTDTTTYSGPNSGSGLPSEVSSSVTISGNSFTHGGHQEPQTL